ncbi:MAG: hypothetical protein EON87_11055 [Brevundimonas sp.]|nr:MAG: hypothetical protein EON87_11055 [Brevundimonas sp.]
MKTNEMRLHGDKALTEWEPLWVRVPDGLKEYQPDLRYKVGLYRVLLNGIVMAIGTGTDKGGGMAKRLSDFIRASWSGRNHYVGRQIYENRDRLVVEVLIVGSDSDARKVARGLKRPMVHHHRPEWTVPSLRPQKAKARQKRPARPYDGVFPTIAHAPVHTAA